MNHTQKVKEHMDAARLARHNRDFELEYKNLFEAAKVWEDAGNLERAARYYIASAKVCRKMADVDAGIEAGEKAVKCYIKQGKSNYAIGLYEDMIGILQREDYAEKAVILKKKRDKLYHQLNNT